MAVSKCALYPGSKNINIILIIIIYLTANGLSPGGSGHNACP
jgi:hypothetical protein